MVQKKVTLSLDDKVYEDFQKYCKNNAIMLSKKIELIMNDIVSDNKKGGKVYILFMHIETMKITKKEVQFSDN